MFEAEEKTVTLCGETVTAKTMSRADARSVCQNLFSQKDGEREIALRDMVSASIFDADGNKVWATGSDISNVKELALLQLIGLAMEVNGMSENPTRAVGPKRSGSPASSGRRRTKSKAGRSANA